MGFHPNIATSSQFPLDEVGKNDENQVC